MCASVVLFIVRESTAEAIYLPCELTDTSPVDRWHSPFRPSHFDAKNSMRCVHEHEYRQLYQQWAMRRCVVSPIQISNDNRMFGHSKHNLGTNCSLPTMLNVLPIANHAKLHNAARTMAKWKRRAINGTIRLINGTEKQQTITRMSTRR